MNTFIVFKLYPSKNPTFLKKNSSVLSLTTQSYLNLSGQKYWARTTGSVYTDMGEQSFVDYFNQIGGIVG